MSKGIDIILFETQAKEERTWKNDDITSIAHDVIADAYQMLHKATNLLNFACSMAEDSGAITFDEKATLFGMHVEIDDQRRQLKRFLKNKGFRHLKPC